MQSKDRAGQCSHVHVGQHIDGQALCTLLDNSLQSHVLSSNAVDVVHDALSSFPKTTLQPQPPSTPPPPPLPCLQILCTCPSSNEPHVLSICLQGLLPQALPHFLQPYSQHFILAGRQLRILNQMQPTCKLFVSQVEAIASSEGAKASLLLSHAPGIAATSEHTNPTGICYVSVHCCCHYYAQHQNDHHYLFINVVGITIIIMLQSHAPGTGAPSQHPNPRNTLFIHAVFPFLALILCYMHVEPLLRNKGHQGFVCHSICQYHASVLCFGLQGVVLIMSPLPVDAALHTHGNSISSVLHNRPSTVKHRCIFNVSHLFTGDAPSHLTAVLPISKPPPPFRTPQQEGTLINAKQLTLSNCIVQGHLKTACHSGAFPSQ